MKTTKLFTQRPMWWFGFLFLGVLLASCDGCEEADISITSIEVSQGIQNTNNTIDFVANRSTVVRAFVSSNGAGDISPIGGSLIVRVDGSEVTPAGGLTAGNIATATNSPQRGNVDHALYFELPGPNGITESSDVDFEVTVNWPNDPDNSNNTMAVNNLNFEKREVPDLLFTRVDYGPGGLGLSPMSDIQPGTGDLFVQGVYPLRDGNANLYEMSIFPVLPFTSDANGNNTIDGNDGSDLLAALSSLRAFEVTFMGHPLNSTFMYGWVNGNPISGNGLGSVGGFNAFGNTQQIRHQRTYAHELGHNFGLNHNSRTINPDVGWDVGARLENNPPGNNTTGRLKGTGLNDIMRGGQLTNSAWVDVTTYAFFESSPILAAPAPAIADSEEPEVSSVFAQNRRQDGKVESILIVQGAFNPKGTELVDLKPTLRLKEVLDRPQMPPKGPFILVVTNTKGDKISMPFDAKVCWDREDNELEYGFFELMVPMPANMEIKSIEILNGETNERMGGMQAEKAPSVKIVEPKAGGSLGDKTTVKWSVDGPDALLQEMLFHLAYSADGGKSWAPVGVHIRGTSYDLNPELLKKSENGRLRLYACHGLNTVITEIGGLKR